MEKPVRAEAPVSVYESMYATDDRTYDNPTASPYYRLFRAAAGAIDGRRVRRILEVGCGSGTLAGILIDRGFAYRGFDYSRTAVEKALRRNPNADFQWGDATTEAPYAEPYDGIVCCEVLEHIDRDLDVVGQWRNGCEVVCSVPNYDHPTHVRFFRDENEVLERYGRLIKIETVVRVSKSPWTGLSWSEYFRRVRWAREDGWQRVCGAMGLNVFSWYGGWFLFRGTRRGV